ncbi:uncharacterized protein LOC109515122 [Hippocampus comes]|uniref:uncharacterized protein LOC109515122 n=1 Tax=Hippocampus comes TaxID=109280 RepID=UPI00094F216D|nr:PREDICTED: uncharacterized protein LOC109515122 [Hippocampus comes]
MPPAETRQTSLSLACRSSWHRLRALPIMEQRRKSSTVWDHFELLENKVKCRICRVELSYANKSTSTMLRHYRAKHENEVRDTPSITPASRKQLVDQALLNFIIKDCQPLSIVESEGFKELIQTIKKMVADKYKEEREKVKTEVQQAVANHTADNLAQVKRGMMEDWAITNKVSCGLWSHLDDEVGRLGRGGATADAISEVQRYLAQGNIARDRDPLLYWKDQHTSFPNLSHLAKEFLCTPASSVRPL